MHLHNALIPLRCQCVIRCRISHEQGEIMTTVKLNVLTLAFVILSISTTLGASPAESKANFNGLVTLTSNYDHEKTVTRLVSKLNEKNMQVFTTIHHHDGAKSVGADIEPTTLVIFGNPKIGSVLMTCSQSVGIDLPQKALIWTNAEGVTFLTYNSPEYLNKRHMLTDCLDTLTKIENALSMFAGYATTDK